MSTTVVRPTPEQAEQQQDSHTEEERVAFYRRVALSQERVKKYIRPGVSLVDGLIEDRRAEARREEQECRQGS